MEFVENNVEPDQVGGMENLKAWMEKREKAYGRAGFAAGKNLPKGVLIMGISGCGKSLFVKAIAARWGLPLVRLDMATVYEGTFGTPESRCARPARRPRPWPPACCGSTRWRRGSPPRGSRPKAVRPPGCSDIFSPGCRKNGSRFSLPPRPTPSKCFPPKFCARAASTKSSMWPCPALRAGGDFPHPPAQKKRRP